MPTINLSDAEAAALTAIVSRLGDKAPPPVEPQLPREPVKIPLRGPWVTHEYSSVCAFSPDNRYFVLIGVDRFLLYRHDSGQAAYLNGLPLPASCEPRWTGPATLAFIQGNELRSYDIMAGNSRPIARFPQYSQISGKGHNDWRSTIPLVGDGRELFTISQSGVVLSPRALPVSGVDYVMTTPSGNVLVADQNVRLYSPTLSYIGRIAPGSPHSDVCRDSEGREYFIWSNSNDPLPIAQNAIIATDLHTGEHRSIFELGWDPSGQHLAVHISCSEVPGGDVLVTTYRPTASTPERGGELLTVAFDGSGIRRRIPHYSIPSYYNAQPKGSLSRDGRFALFASNSGRNAPDFAETWLVEL